MAIQTELFKEKDTQIVVRCKESLKVGVQELAKENGLSLSGYVKYLLIQELKKSKKWEIEIWVRKIWLNF